MKAMVVSIKGKRAAVLAHDGTFNEIKNRNYKIGQILDYKLPDLSIINFTTKHSSKIAAAAAAVLLVTGTLSANTYAYSTVTLDVNPSLRYGLNIFDRVVELDSYNNDGEEIADLIRKEIMGKKIDTALDITFDALEDADYIEEDTPVVVTVASHMGKEEKLKDRTLDEVNSWNEKKHSGNNSSISANMMVITGDELKAADERDDSPGRIMLDQIKEMHNEEVGPSGAENIPPVQEEDSPDHKQPSQAPDTNEKISSEPESVKNEDQGRTDPKERSGDLTVPKEQDNGNRKPQDSNGGNQKPQDPAGGNQKPQNPNNGNIQPQEPASTIPADQSTGNPNPQDTPPTMPGDPNAGNEPPQDAPPSPPEGSNTNDPQPSDAPPDVPDGQNEGGQPPEQGAPPSI